MDVRWRFRIYNKYTLYYTDKTRIQSCIFPVYVYILYSLFIDLFSNCQAQWVCRKTRHNVFFISIPNYPIDLWIADTVGHRRFVSYFADDENVYEIVFRCTRLMSFAGHKLQRFIYPCIALVPGRNSQICCGLNSAKLDKKYVINHVIYTMFIAAIKFS